MFIAVYRWTVRAGKEAEFQEAWLTLTKAIYEKRGSLGSRLHKAEDGTWLGYAQWSSKEIYDEASTKGSADPQASALMAECIESSQPPLFLQVVSDFLQTATT